jgi:hypothetical protein
MIELWFCLTSPAQLREVKITFLEKSIELFVTVIFFFLISSFLSLLLKAADKQYGSSCIHVFRCALLCVSDMLPFFVLLVNIVRD